MKEYKKYINIPYTMQDTDMFLSTVYIKQKTLLHNHNYNIYFYAFTPPDPTDVWIYVLFMLMQCV